MKSNEFRKIQVNITTYKKDSLKEQLKNMNGDQNRRNYNQNKKLICSICLNCKPEDKFNDNNKWNFKSCPICQRSCDICMEKITNKTEKIQNETEKLHKTKTDMKGRDKPKNTHTKSSQTVQTDLNKSMNLLNEVLTVFQSKKLEQTKSTVVLKDASVSTNDVRTLNSKLSVSKAFQFSINQNRDNDNEKFIVMNSKIYERPNIDLIKNKSSSIPRMKLEELKYNLKEKTISKDAIEEVNKMFATVRKNYNNDNLNRPSIRSGPRILPVVETIDDHNEKHFKNGTIFPNNCFKCCQTSNMSSGDSIKCCHEHDTSECCHKKGERCEKCVYMLCCHYKNCRHNIQGVMICERCRDAKQLPWKASDRSFEDSG